MSSRVFPPASAQSSHPFLPLIEDILETINSRSTWYAYRRALLDFLTWYQAQDSPALTQALIKQYGVHLRNESYGAATISQRLLAIRKLVHAVAHHKSLGATGLISTDTLDLFPKSVDRSSGLSFLEAQRLLEAPEMNSLRGLRDRAILAVSVGSDLRRSDISRLMFDPERLSENKWVVVNLKSKYQRIRVVPLPVWVQARLVAWQQAAGITSTEYVFCALHKGAIRSETQLTPERLKSIVTEYARATDLEPLTFKDLRLTFKEVFSGGTEASEMAGE